MHQDALTGSLTVRRTLPDGTVETYLIASADGSVTGYNGHVDLGTGIRTALAQIVAEELDVSFSDVQIVLGDTGKVPNQGPTIASETIQVAAVPLRKAAAQARHHLLLLASEKLELSLIDLTVEDGLVRGKNNRSIRYTELIAGRDEILELADSAITKPVSEYRIVGQEAARVDIPAKASGQLTYVHDMRVPGMLHGRVVRPPYSGLDAGDFIGNSLVAIDESSISHIEGIIKVVRIADFVGIVAIREENAEEAAAQLRIQWKPSPSIPNLRDIETALRANASKSRVLLDKGDVEAAIDAAATPMKRTYVWPYQMHASIGPSCSVADFGEGGVRVWSGTQRPHILRSDLALLLGVPEQTIDVIRMEAAGCYGRNCADDVSADAALLSREVGRPVRVQLTRAQEHLWEPKGSAQLMDVNGGLNQDGSAAAYDFQTRYPSNGAPTLALLLTKTISATPDVYEWGDRTAIPPYDYDHMRIVAHDMPPIVRTGPLRGVAAVPNCFAHESYIDELATHAGVDPIEYRLRYLKDPRAVDLVKALAERGQWVPRPTWRAPAADGDIVKGRGFAYALYMHSTFPGTPAAYAAWIADVSVNQATGQVSVTRVVVGQESGLMINPAGVRHQIHGNVVQTTSRALMEEVSFDQVGVAARDWGTYPIISFPDTPEIDVLMLPRPDQPPLGVGESATVPGAAAIANAIFDATGVRFRELPFTPERILSGLDANHSTIRPGKSRSFAKKAIVFCAALAATAMTWSPWRSSIPSIPRPDPAAYSSATIQRGAQLAALGACAVCHTAPGGIQNAGGRTLETPFGVVYSSNITPDVLTGIGGWSFSAFERAMREGIHRDGRHLYPAFPYNHFANTSDADLQALYAYLMAQPPTSQTNPETKLSFPFNIRSLLAGWNALFLRRTHFEPDPSRPATWNRGAYLVEGLGHCGSCHTPRNILGAEKAARLNLTGGWADGWEAPGLTALSRSPVPWTEQELFSYLRSGVSKFHGVAGGPMAAVVRELEVLPDEDIKAMAVYLSSFGQNNLSQQTQEALALRVEASSYETSLQNTSPGARMYQGACAACHQVGGPPTFGDKLSLALNSNLHSDSPDNLIQVILHGMTETIPFGRGYMPAFGSSFNDGQVVELVSYLRRQFAPDKRPWTGLSSAVARLRKSG